MYRTCTTLDFMSRDTGRYFFHSMPVTMYDDIDSQRCDVNDFRFKENCQAILLRPYEFDENVLLRRLRHSM